MTSLALTHLGRSLTAGEFLVRGVVIVWLAVMFALFPDIDIKSKGQLLFYRLLFVLDVCLVLAQLFREAAVLGLLALIPILSRHRGWTHTIWAAILVPLPLLAAPLYTTGKVSVELVVEWAPYYVGAVAGYVSHLLADGILVRPRRRTA